MKIKFHGVKNLWSKKDKPMMGKYFTFQWFTINYIEKTDKSWMFHFVIFNFSFIWVSEDLKPKLNIPIDEE